MVVFAKYSKLLMVTLIFPLDVQELLTERRRTDIGIRESSVKSFGPKAEFSN